MRPCVLFLLTGMLFLTFHVVGTAGGMLYVRPTDASNTSCPSQPCLTLDQYISSSETYFKSNSWFLFIPGLHQVSASVIFRELKNVSLSTVDGEKSAHLIFNTSCLSFNPKRNHFDGGNHPDNVSQDSNYPCSLLNFENVDRVKVQGIIVSSVISGASIVLNETVDAQIQQCVFACSEEAMNTTAILVTNANSTVIDDVYTVNCSIGISVHYSNFTNISNATSECCRDVGVLVNASSNTTIDKALEMFTYYGLVVRSSCHTRVIDSSISHAENGGIIIEYSSNATISNTTVYQCNMNLVLLNSSHIEIDDSTASSSEVEHGLMILGCNNISVLGMDILQSNESEPDWWMDINHFYLDSVLIA